MKLFKLCNFDGLQLYFSYDPQITKIPRKGYGHMRYAEIIPTDYADYEKHIIETLLDCKQLDDYIVHLLLTIYPYVEPQDMDIYALENLWIEEKNI